ncbi:hypothetical protein Droror1_Dr00017560 [Drosera rotundifolia]
MENPVELTGVDGVVVVGGRFGGYLRFEGALVARSVVGRRPTKADEGGRRRVSHEGCLEACSDSWVAEDYRLGWGMGGDGCVRVHRGLGVVARAGVGRRRVGMAVRWLLVGRDGGDWWWWVMAARSGSGIR